MPPVLQPQAPPDPVVSDPASDPIVYPEYAVSIHAGPNAMTVEQIKEMLGWQEDSEEAPLGDDYVPELLSLFGRKIRMTRNVNNRPIITGWVRTLGQEHLNRRWKFNGESLVVGRNGNTQSGQHRSISLIYAEEQRTGREAAHWEHLWSGPITMETVVVYGIDESDDVFKTLNSGKPSTLAEVFYRSEFVRQITKAKDRKVFSRVLDFAIRTLWDRTGAKNNAFAPKLTHGEAVDFLNRHPRIMEAVTHLIVENKDKAISGVVPLGCAAGLMYLMAACRSDPEAYRKNDPRSESALDFSEWEKAMEFWVLFASRSPTMKAVENGLASLVDEDTGRRASLEERVAVLCRAWVAFVIGGRSYTLVPDDVRLKYVTSDEDESRSWLAVPYTVGGIDLGPTSGQVGGEEKDDEDDGSGEPAAPLPETPEDREKARREKAAEVAEVLRQRRLAQRPARDDADAPVTAPPPNGKPVSPPEDGTVENPAKVAVPESGLAAEISQLKGKYGNALLLFKVGNSVKAYGEDAQNVAKLFKVPVSLAMGLPSASFQASGLEENLKRLLAAGYRVAVCEQAGEKAQIMEPEAPPKPGRKPAPKPANKK